MIQYNLNFDCFDLIGEIISSRSSKYEVPVSARFEPVQLSILHIDGTYNSSLELKFDQCAVKTSTRKVIRLRNESLLLPIKFNFPKIANFHCRPNNGVIDALEYLHIDIVFAPNQQGIFTRTSSKYFLC